MEKWDKKEREEMKKEKENEENMLNEISAPIASNDMAGEEIIRETTNACPNCGFDTVVQLKVCSTMCSHCGSMMGCSDV